MTVTDAQAGLIRKWFMAIGHVPNQAVAEALLSLSNTANAGVADTGVTAGTYGDATHVPRFEVGADGRLINVTNVAIAAGATTHPAGLGFFIQGYVPDDTLLGGTVFPVPITFSASDPNIDVYTPFPALAPASFRILLAKTSAQVGTVTFAAGANTATVAWASEPYTLPAGEPLVVYTPTPADPNLATVFAKVAGTFG